MAGCRGFPPPPLLQPTEPSAAPHFPPRPGQKALLHISAQALPLPSHPTRRRAPPLALTLHHVLIFMTIPFTSNSEMRIGNGSIKIYIIKGKTMETMKRSVVARGGVGEKDEQVEPRGF